MDWSFRQGGSQIESYVRLGYLALCDRDSRLCHWGAGLKSRDIGNNSQLVRAWTQPFNQEAAAPVNDLTAAAMIVGSQ